MILASGEFNWNAVGAISTAVSSIFAMWLLVETIRLRRVSTDPEIVVRVEHDRERATLLTIVIENIGRGVARNVRFELSRPIPRFAPGLSLDEVEGKFAPMEQGPLIHGIPLLAPGSRRVLDWGQYGGLRSALGRDVVDVRAYYKGGNRDLYSASMLEVESYAWTDAASSVEERVANSLEKIEKSLSNIGSGYSKIGCVITTKAEMVAEREATLERFRKSKEAAAGATKVEGQA